ncbi:MAG: hypothetical protein JNK00_05390 [Flavipsychrobacter sp.]|nr:hypothetical protein [Flavipsychrobacter sp.]
MYRFVYYFIYKFQRTKEDDYSSRYLASLSVFITIVFHLFFITSCARFFFNFNGKLFIFSEDNLTNKLIQVAISIPFILLTNLYFNKKRAEKIIDNFDDAYYSGKMSYVFSAVNILLFFLITIAPIAIGAYLINHSAMILERQ